MTSDRQAKTSVFRIALQLVLAAAFIIGVLTLVRPGAFAEQLTSISLSALLVTMVLQALIIMLLALRWQVLIRASGARVGFWPAFRMTTHATVMNLTLPTSVGGDVARVAFGQDAGVSLSQGSAAALLDRGIGLAVLVGFVWLGLFWINISLAVLTGLLGLMALVGLWFIKQRTTISVRLPERFQSFSRALTLAVNHQNASAMTVSLSVLAHLGSVGIAVILANGMGVSLSVIGAFITFPAVILASAIPLSVGGWGIREMAAIPLMGLVAIAPESAAAIATLFAMSQLITGLIIMVIMKLGSGIFSSP